MEAEDQTEDLIATQRAYLNASIGNFAPPPVPPEVLARQREQQERYERREREDRDNSVRQAALHGALLLEYPSKDAASVLTAARQIESFLRGEASQAAAH